MKVALTLLVNKFPVVSHVQPRRFTMSSVFTAEIAWTAFRVVALYMDTDVSEEYISIFKVIMST